MERFPRRRSCSPVVVLAAAAMVITTAGAAPASVCSSLEFKIAGKYAKQSVACYAKAIRKGVGVDAECLSKSYLRFQARWAKAEGKGDCLTEADANQAGGVVSGIFLAGLAFYLGPDGSAPPSVCTGLKYKAAARSVVRRTKCWAKAIRNGVPVDAECLAKTEARMVAKWSKAEQVGDCLTTGDAAAAVGVVDAFFVSLEPILLPIPPTPTPTPSPSGPNCCGLGNAIGISIGVCLPSHTDSNQLCIQLGGVPSAVGEVCDAGSGTCKPPPSSPGNCCQPGCIMGPGVTAPACADLFGTLFLNSICVEGKCVAP